MGELIHETYRNLFQEMQTENLHYTKPKIVENYLPSSVYFPPIKESREISGNVFGLVGMAIGVMLTLGGSLIFSSANEKAVQTAAVLTTPTLSISNDEAQALRADMELTKKILAGLVQSVQTLSVSAEPKLQAVSDLNEFPYPIQVLTEKANLRERPGITQKALVTVPKNTVLLAMEEKDGWLRVSTPKGEEAWVSLDIVQRKG